MQQIILSLKTLHDWWLLCETLKYNNCYCCFFQTKLPEIRWKVISGNFKFKHFPGQAAPCFVAGPQWQSLHTTKLTLCRDRKTHLWRAELSGWWWNKSTGTQDDHISAPSSGHISLALFSLVQNIEWQCLFIKKPKQQKPKKTQTNHLAK